MKSYEKIILKFTQTTSILLSRFITKCLGIREIVTDILETPRFITTILWHMSYNVVIRILYRLNYANLFRRFLVACITRHLRENNNDNYYYQRGRNGTRIVRPTIFDK